MPLQKTGSPNYVKVTQFYVNSDDRLSGSVYDYYVDLTDEVQYVAGMEVTAVNFPMDMAPTFLAGGPTTKGTDKLDFELKSGGNTEQFTVTFPRARYSYAATPAIGTLSYTAVLKQLMQEAVVGSANFSTVTFTVTSDAEERTSVTVSAGTLSFLFASGTNAGNSAFSPMGFTQTDTVAASSIVSPKKTNLRPYRFIDINIEEAREFSPNFRVWTTSPNSMSLSTIPHRTRLLSSKPIHRLKRLRITITLEGGLLPTYDEGGHDFLVTIFSLSNEQSVPPWVRQGFNL